MFDGMIVRRVGRFSAVRLGVLLSVAAVLLSTVAVAQKSNEIPAAQQPQEAISSFGQSGTSQAEARKKAPAYEVVSVKPSQPGCPGMSINEPLGRYQARCITLWGLMYNAYKVRSFEGYPPGLPGWADQDKFDIEAKVDHDTYAATEKLTRQQQDDLSRAMRQSLLSDRFQVRIHYESRVEPIYELVLAKGGIKLKPLAADQERGGWNTGPGEMKLGGTSIAEFAHVLSVSNIAGRTVADKTGVIGIYDINLKWTPDDKQGTPDAGPTLFTALEEQLGLKLKAAKGPVETFVVDHAEKPSEN